MRAFTLITAAAAALLATAASAAPSTFAQFQQTTNADSVQVTNGSGSTGQLLTVGNPIVKFDFLEPALVAAGFGSQDAIFSMTAFISQPATTTVQIGPDPFNQLIDYGTISFTRTVAAPINTAQGNRTNLLTIQFTNAVLQGSAGGTSGSVIASTGDSVLTYTSDFLSFTNATSLDFSLGLSSITGGGLGQTAANESARAFTADSTGTFSSDPSPQYTAPEPAALGLLGLGFAGLALRRRRRAA